MEGIDRVIGWILMIGVGGLIIYAIIKIAWAIIIG